MKKVAGKILFLFIVFNLFTNYAQAKTFSDLNADYWAQKEINILATDDVLIGYPDGTFRPEQPATRAEFVTMVIKALWQENTELMQIYYYNDVPQNYWAYEMIQIASDFELLNKYSDGTFKPDKNLKRAEAISIVISAVDAGEMTELQAKNLLSVYDDASEIPDWAIISTAKAQKFSLISKNPACSVKYFKPNKLITRAEIAVTLYNMRKQALLRPNKKLADAFVPKTAQGIQLENVTMESNGIIAIIPKGTLLKGILVDEYVNSQKVELGNMFSVKTQENYVTKENYLLIPTGTNIVGEIVKVRKAKYFIRNAKMDTNAKRIIMDNGYSANFYASMRKPAEKQGFFSRIFRAVVKGKKIKIQQGDVVCVKTLKPIKVDVAKTIILSD